MLAGRKILLGITGSIAAYKTAILVRLLIREGATVQVLMTNAAADFVSPLTLSTLSKQPVLQDLATENNWANHVMLGRWADIMLVAPLSCNTLAKMATGICDNLLTAVYLSATCPVALAAAMDEDMWLHPTTKHNIERLQSFGNLFLPVNSGELASGLHGQGRMAEPEEIVAWLNNYFDQQADLKGKKILISAGPTHEPIDPVRFIGNRSSGKMGIALVNECLARGATVTLVLGPVTEPVVEHVNLHCIRVETAAEMYEACLQNFEEANIAIMCAAVADFSADKPAKEKMKNHDDQLTLRLRKTKDILKTLGEKKTTNQILVGFALETNNEIENAKKKLSDKNADYIVLNTMNDEGAGFSHNSNKITIFDKWGNQFPFETKPKSAVAADIIHTILNNKHA